MNIANMIAATITPRPKSKPKPDSHILDEYVQSPPSEQATLDLFEGEWSSAFPVGFSHLAAGPCPLFQDPRIAWAVQQLGDITGYRCLELGPLEGGHSYMLEQAGAEHVLAIESNQRAFLKCLIVKNLLNLTRTRFMLGNFVPFLEADNDDYDLIVASGVLYHMQEPAHLLRLISERSQSMFLWTHYFDEEVIRSQPHLSEKFGDAEHCTDQGFRYTVHRQTYGGGLKTAGFCGGGTETTNWMTRDSILSCLDILGYSKVDISFEEPDHPNGPSFAIMAVR